MANEALGANFSIDVTDLKTGLAQANRLIRESESEFKAAAAGMDDWSGSQEGLEARVKNLNTVTDLQKKKVGALQAEYDRMIADGLDPTSKAAVDLRTKINNETAALNKNEKALGETETALARMRQGLDDTGAAADDAGKGLDGLKSVAGGVAGAVAAVGAACVAAVGSFFALAESTRESRTQMGKLETAFEQAGLSAETAGNTFTDLYGVLGDEGKATESAAFLAQYADNEKELAEQTRILTGVFATYGDSIPTEGLAEGISATIAMGETQGVLADALEWQGVNLDEFNEKLAACTDEQEREALITQTLNGLYGEAADKYKEVNADVIAAQEAQAGLNQALNDIGAIAEPIMTTLKTLATDLLNTILPFVEIMGEGLQDALNGSAGAADKIAEGLSGMLVTALDKITAMLPTVIQTIVAIVPKILTALIQRLPMILTTLLNLSTQIINALSQMLPKIITAIMAILPQLINALISAIPQLIQAAVTLLLAIVQAIPQIIPPLIAALPSIIQTIITAFTQSIPILIEAAIQLLMAIVDAIPVIIDALIVALPQIINTVINGLIESIPALLDGAIQFLLAIVQAIPTIISALITNLPTIISTITQTLLNNIPLLLKTAVELFMAIVTAIPEIVSDLWTALSDLCGDIFDALREGLADIADIGSEIVDGIWEGVKSGWDWLTEQVSNIATSLLDAAKAALGIHSPSKLFADEVGKNMALGIGVGFDKALGGVKDKISDSVATLADGGINANINGTATGATGGGKNVVVNQINHYSQAHSRFEIYHAKEQTAAAVKLAIMGA